jgi:hypothetical protein
MEVEGAARKMTAMQRYEKILEAKGLYVTV